MAFTHACFISYCHAQGYLMKRFVDELKEQLKSELDTYFDDCVYIDEDRLQPGFKFNEALGKALCQSACMILIYVPKYDEHSYCVRELRAMELLEARRKNLLAGKLPKEFGMIIPIVLREGVGVPEKIKSKIHYSDFTRYTTATTTIRDNPQYADQIKDIAKYIHGVAVAFRDLDPCQGCNEFLIPPLEEGAPATTEAPPPPFPNRDI
jgi:hypothetical protein